MKHELLVHFARLASQAAGETTPETDVGNRVLATLRLRERTFAVRDPEFLWLGFGSMVAAGVAVAVFWLGGGDDSLLTLVQPFVTVMP